MSRKNKKNQQIVVVRNQRKGKGGRKNGRVKNAGIRGITQSTAVSATMPFGDNPKRATIEAGLDAFNPCSVPLPRPIGDYTVIRTTQVVSGTEALSLFGPVTYSSAANQAGTSDLIGPTWSNICRQASVNGALAMNGEANTRINSFSAMSDSSWNFARMVPAAFSVQIMNPEALQTTSGIVYIGRSKQQLATSTKTISWNDLANELVSYSNPRLCSAGKVALNGVQVNGVPYDMNAMADFRERRTATNGTTFTSSDPGVKFDAFAPIFVYNPEGIDLQYLVCCEWRVRFDPSNPAYASSTYHPASTLGYWDALQRHASSIGNGVMDMAHAMQPHLSRMAPAVMQYHAQRYGMGGGPPALRY